MSNSKNELAAVTSRAKRRFPDHTLDNVYPVCVPVQVGDVLDFISLMTFAGCWDCLKTTWLVRLLSY